MAQNDDNLIARAMAVHSWNEYLALGGANDANGVEGAELVSMANIQHTPHRTTREGLTSAQGQVVLSGCLPPGHSKNQPRPLRGHKRISN